MAIGDTGTDGSGRKSLLVPETGDYRFVFIVGIDKTGGPAAGADMTIDNIRGNAYSIEENAYKRYCGQFIMKTVLTLQPPIKY